MIFCDLLTRESYKALGLDLQQIIEQLRRVLIQLDRKLAREPGGVPPPLICSRTRNLRLLFPREEEVRASRLVDPDNGKAVVTTVIRVRIQVRDHHMDNVTSSTGGGNKPVDSGSELDIPDLIDSKGHMVL